MAMLYRHRANTVDTPMAMLYRHRANTVDTPMALLHRHGANTADTKDGCYETSCFHSKYSLNTFSEENGSYEMGFYYDYTLSSAREDLLVNYPLITFFHF